MYFVFLLGGGARLIFIMLISFVLIDLLNFSYTISYATALLMAANFTFFYNRHITFNRLPKWKSRFLKSSLVVVLIGSANWALVYIITEAIASHFGTEALPAYYWPIIIIVTLILSVMNFIFNRNWVFKTS